MTNLQNPSSAARSAHLRYQFARQTLRIKAGELRPLRRDNRIPLWRDIEAQYVRSALNRRAEYYEAKRLMDCAIKRAATIRLAHGLINPVDPAPDLYTPDPTPDIDYHAVAAVIVLAMVFIFCIAGFWA